MVNSYDFLKEAFSSIDCKCSDGKFPHIDLEENGKFPLVKCAILILLFRKNNEFNLLLTVRSSKLKSYPGELCYPGKNYLKPYIIVKRCTYLYKK